MGARSSIFLPSLSPCTDPDPQHTLLPLPPQQHRSQHSCSSQHELLKIHFKARLASPSPPGVHRLCNFSRWVDYFGSWGLFEHCSAPERFSKCGDGNACTLSHTPHAHACSLPNTPFSHPQTNSVSHRDTITASAALILKSLPSQAHAHAFPFPLTHHVLAWFSPLRRFISQDPYTQWSERP